MGIFTLGKEQEDAVNKALVWLNSGFVDKPIFVIGGYAGTGKSTIVNHLIMETGIPKHKIAYVTFTGKAAVNLRAKNIGAITAHKLIYNTYCSPGKPPSFKRKPKIPANIELIVIDELGMLPQNITEDILKYRISVIGLGDPGQLPPIFGENKYMANPDAFLTECYRTVGPALQLATDIRNNTFNVSKQYGKEVIIDSINNLNIVDLLKYDQILCGTNDMRKNINSAIRYMNGLTSPLPKNGEKIVCMQNNFTDKFGEYNGVDINLVNGMIGTVIGDAVQLNDTIGELVFKPDFLNKPFKVLFLLSDFIENSEDDFTPKFTENPHNSQIQMINRFDYAYAITVHKSQGSEWDSIAVINDCFYNDATMIRRWLYTAVTRTKKYIKLYM